MKQKGLGRGLNALFGDGAVEAAQHPKSQISEIEIGKITPNALQPRQQFDEEALAELAESIRTLGLIQPITVRRNGEQYTIISGERRWRAAQQVGLTHIAAYVRDVEDNDLHAMALVENIQRQDLNAIEIALGMQRLVDECGLTQEALAEKVGKKRSTVANYMRLLDMPDRIQYLVKDGVLTMGHAKALLSLAGDDEQLSVAAKIVKSSMSVRQTEDYVRALGEKSQKPAKNTIDEEYPESYTRLVEYLEQLFTQNISIKRSKSGGGRITIGFDSDKDIDNFIARLSKKRGTK